MSPDVRLRVDLQVLRLCFAAYLERLRAAWQLDGQAAGAEIERIVASVGVRPEPGRAALAEVRSLLATKPSSGDRLAELTSALGLSPGEELLVAAAWWAEADPQFAIVLGCAHDDGARRYASAALLRLVLEPFGVDAPPALDDSGTLVANGVLEAGSGATEPLRPTGATRLLLAGGLPDPRAPGLSLRTVAGGFLAQARDNAVVDGMALEVVTRRAPTNRELADLKFAFRVAKHVKSNAIVYAREVATVGIGAGQMSRVDSSRIAAWKAAEAAKSAGLADSLAKGAVVASDAFFPFADGLLAAAEAGATAVIQPGGSVRDDEVIRAADDAGLAMVFTGHRHFRH